MPKQDPLYALIQSLSKAEKRYFKLFSSRYDSDAKKNYIRLFDYLDKLPDYDERRVKKRFSGEKLSKNLSAAKGYLRSMILRSMRAMHGEHSVDMQIQELLQDAHFLEAKGFQELTRKTLEKAKALARQYERTHFLLVINEEERKDLRAYAQKERSMEMEGVVAENKLIREQISYYFDALETFDRLFLFARNKLKSRTQEDQTTLDHLLNSLQHQQPTSFFQSLYYHAGHILIGQMKGDPKGSQLHYDQLISLWDSRPDLIRIHSKRYRQTLSNYLGNCHNLGLWHLFPPILEKLKTLPTNTLDEEAEAFQNDCYLELLYCINSGKLAGGEEKIPWIVQNLDRYGERINRARKMAIYFNIVILYFLQEKYTLVLQWLAKLTDLPPSEHREDLQFMNRLLELVALFQTGSVQILEKKLRGTRRLLKRREAFQDFEDVFLTEFVLLYQASDLKTRRLNAARMQARLKALKTSEVALPGVGLEEIETWLESLVTGKSIRELARIRLMG